MTVLVLIKIVASGVKRKDIVLVIAHSLCTVVFLLSLYSAVILCYIGSFIDIL